MVNDAVHYACVTWQNLGLIDRCSLDARSPSPVSFLKNASSIYPPSLFVSLSLALALTKTNKQYTQRPRAYVYLFRKHLFRTR